MECTDYFKSGEQFGIMKCKSCSLLFTNPVPDEDEIDFYYDSEEYFSHKNRSKGITGNLYMMLRKISIRKKYRLINHYKHEGSILDYGCGTGELAGYFAEKGWVSFGYEPGASASVLLNEVQSVRALANEDLGSLVKYFDVITLWHVLEHIPKLTKAIEFLRSALKDDGLLFIAVPNYRSKDAEIYGKFWAAWDVPRHLYHFEKDTLISLFQRFGFECRGSYALKMDAYYISLISEKYKTGHRSYIKAACNGFRSNLAGSKKNMNYSSTLLVFSKHNLKDSP